MLESMDIVKVFSVALEPEFQLIVRSPLEA
jgi:hypothetical protein